MLKERFLETNTVFTCGIELLNMNIEELQVGVLRGSIASVGGKENQNKDAMNAFLCCERPNLVEKISDVLATGKKQERLYVPALNVIYTILLHSPRDIGDVKLVVKRVRANWKGRMRDIKHMAAATNVLGELMDVQAREALMVVLGCGVPRIRRIAAETICLVLVNYCMTSVRPVELYPHLFGQRGEQNKFDPRLRAPNRSPSKQDDMSLPHHL